MGNPIIHFKLVIQPTLVRPTWREHRLERMCRAPPERAPPQMLTLANFAHTNIAQQNHGFVGCVRSVASLGLSATTLSQKRRALRTRTRNVG